MLNADPKRVLGGSQQRLIAAAFFAICALTPAPAQQSASVRLPAEVKAGENVDLEITVDKAPNFNGGAVQIWIQGTGHYSLQSSCEIAQGERSCHFSFQVPADASGGTWSVSKLMFYTGTRQIDLSFHGQSFTVIPNSGLIFPSSAEVALNPSQVQLLRGEARAVQIQTEELKSRLNELNSSQSASERKLLIENVELAASKLQETENQLFKLAPSAYQANGGKIFFEDLNRNYQNAQKDLATKKAFLPNNAAHLVLVSDAAREGYSPLAQVVLRALEQNELGYASVADSGSFCFNLRVESEPPGATITFKRRGDPDYQSSQDPTNSTLQNIPKAITLVHYHLAGWHDTEIEFNPFTAAEDVVLARLSK